MNIDARIQANDRLLGSLQEKVEETANNLQATKKAIEDIERAIPQTMDEDNAREMVDRMKDLRDDKHYLAAREESLHREIYQLREENISLLRLKSHIDLGGQESKAGDTGSQKLKDILLRGIVVAELDDKVMNYMRKRFPQQTSLILLEENIGFAVDIYNQAKQLPFEETEMTFEQIGYKLSSEVYMSNEKLIPCYKGSRAYLVKSLTQAEYDRILSFTAEAQKHMPKSPEESRVIFYELHLVRNKPYMVMPRLLGNLSEIPTPISMECCRTLYENMTSALEFIHSIGYCHMDIKPSNILLTETGHFVLADLSSLTRKGEFVNNVTMHRYLPRDYPGKHAYNTYTQTYTESAGSVQAGEGVDWWMLAMAFADKAGDVFNVLAVEAMKQEVKQLLERALNAEVATPLLQKLSALEQAT